MTPKIAPASRIEFTALVIGIALFANVPAFAVQQQGTGIGAVLPATPAKTAAASSSAAAKAKASAQLASKKAAASQGPATGNK